MRLQKKQLLKKIIKAFERQGGEIRMGTEEAKILLKMRRAEGICLDEKLIYLVGNPSTSAVYEELIYSSQYRTG